jgi:hypothetical protein
MANNDNGWLGIKVRGQRIIDVGQGVKDNGLDDG